MIKAIVLDFSGVVVFPANFDKFSRYLSKKTGIPFKKLHGEFHVYWQDWKTGKVSYDFVLNSIFNYFDIPEKYKTSIKDYFSKYYRVNKSLMEYIKKLKEQYSLYILSNQVKELYEPFAKKHGFDRFFDGEFISYEHGCAKPHAKFFNKFLKHTGFKPQECVFVDNQTNNINGAQALGFKTILYKNFKQFRSELNNLI